MLLETTYNVPTTLPTMKRFRDRKMHSIDKETNQRKKKKQARLMEAAAKYTKETSAMEHVDRAVLGTKKLRSTHERLCTAWAIDTSHQ